MLVSKLWAKYSAFVHGHLTEHRGVGIGPRLKAWERRDSEQEEEEVTFKAFVSDREKPQSHTENTVVVILEGGGGGGGGGPFHFLRGGRGSSAEVVVAWMGRGGSLPLFFSLLVVVTWRFPPLAPP